MKKQKKIYDLASENDNESLFFVELKLKIYTTYFEIIESQQLGQIMGIVMIVILNMQLIFMTASTNNSDLVNSAVSSLLPLSSYVLLYPELLNATSVLFNLLFLIVMLILLCFLIITIFYLSIQDNFDRPLIKSLKSISGFMSQLTDKILVIPVFGLMVGNLNCNFSNNQTICWGATHIILIILSLICSFLMLILEMLYSYLFFNFTFKIKDSLSRNPSGMPVFFLFYRLAVTIYQSQFDLSSKSTYNILVFLHLILGMIMMYDSLNHFPYHNKNVSKTQGIFTSVYLWMNATFIVLQLTSIDMLNQNVLVIVGLGMAFFLKLYLNVRNYFVKVLMNSELDEISSAVLLDLKIRNYNTLAKTLGNQKKSELLLASLLKIHYDKCKSQVTCPCRNRNALYDPKKKNSKDQAQQLLQTQQQLHKDSVFVKHFIARMAKEGLNKFKDSKLLYLDYMFYRFEALRLYSSIYFEVEKFENRYHNDMSLTIEFCLFRLRSKLKKYLNNRNQKNEISRRLNVQNVKYFDEGIIKQKENIINVNKQFNDLWDCLCEEKPDLSKLLEIGNIAINSIQTTTDNYEFLLQLNNQSQDLLNLMTIFAQYLTYDDLLAKKVEKDIEQSKDMENDNSLQQDLKQLIRKYQIFDKQSCVISISPNLENIGQIIWSSRNVRNVFGIDDFSNMNINQFMPEPIALTHNRILRYFYENGREQFTTKLTHIWAMDADKVCFSANIFIKILPSLQSYDIVGFIHKLNQDDYIVTDVDGMMYAIGRKVSDALRLTPEYVAETKVNIQLLAPVLQAQYKGYFTNFEIFNTNVDQRVQSNYDDENIEELKFFFLISKENKLKIQSFVEIRQMIFKKFNVDPITKEPPIPENFQQNQMNQMKELIKLVLDYKKEYAALFYKVNKQIMVSKLETMVKVKAQLRNFNFWNGSKVVQLKIMKINNYEMKTKEYIKINQGRVRAQADVVRALHEKLKQDHLDYKTKKMKMKEEDEQDNFEELEQVNKDQDVNPAQQQIKGFARMFNKQIQKVPQKNNLFSKLNRKGNLQGEQSEDQQKKVILDTLFKKSKNQLRQKFKRTSKQSDSVMKNEAKTHGEESEDDDEGQVVKKKLEVTPAQLEQIKSCTAIPKILRVLYRANIVGQAEWSIFSEPQFIDLYIEKKINKFSKIQNFVKSEKFQALIRPKINKNKGNKQSNSSNTDEDKEEQSEMFEDEQQEERSLLRNFQNALGGQDEDRAAMQSVSSSTQSLQAHNQQKLLREQLKNMKAPTVLIVAHYTMILMCLLLFSLIIAQYVKVTQDFGAIKQELAMYERVSNYSNRIIELLDGYYTLQQINEGPLQNVKIYSSDWQTQYRAQLFYTQNDLLQFFLQDFSKAGAFSSSGVDLRSYFFVKMNASMLVNRLPASLSINFQDYVRLLTNAINQTIGSDLSVFKLTSNNDYFYFIYNNLDTFLKTSNYNFNKIDSFLYETRINLITTFYYFWSFSFAILFLLYLFIYPIILRTKTKISETLKLFTIISISNVEYYSSHYKMIFYLFRTVQDTATLLKKIEEDVLSAAGEKRRKDQQNNQKTLARARPHKGIQINKIVFFIAMTLCLFFFSGFLFIKDFFIVQFVGNLDNFNVLQNQQHHLKFNLQKLYIQTKNLYYLKYKNQTFDTAPYISELESFSIYQLLYDSYENFYPYSSQYQAFIQQFDTADICSLIKPYFNQFPNISQTHCETIINQMLNFSSQGFYEKLKNDLINGLKQLQLSTFSKELQYYIQQQQLQDYIPAFIYIRIVNEYWASLGRASYSQGIDQVFILIFKSKQINFNTIFVIINTLIIFTFLILIWGKEFLELKRNSRWVNGFILLIPTDLRSENKKINSFLKNQLKVQGLMYV